ncbi:MAG: O-antigen ligase family protein [Bacteroidota bacterium]|jgi:hypothetical protein
MNLRIRNFLVSIYPYSFVLFAFSIPINYRISLYALGFITLIGALLIAYKKNLDHVFKSKISIVLIFFWVLHLLSLFYTSNISYGLSDVFQKISLLIIPIVFIPDFINKNSYLLIHKAFILGLILSSLYFVVRALVLSIVITPVGIFFKPNPVGVPWENFFFYDLFVKPHHPTYYSMYLTLGISFLLISIREKSTLLRRLPIYLLIAYFIGIIFLTSSKAGIITTFVVFIISLFWLLKSKGKLVLLGTLIVSIFFGIYFITHNSRFTTTIKNLKEFNFKTEVSDELAKKDLSRLEIWKSVPNVFKGSEWLYGVGVGDIKEKLKDAYRLTNALYAYNEELNTHNQFLQTLVGIGLIGSIALIIILGYSTYIALKSKDIIFISFIIIVFMNFMFEAVLERVFGVLYLAFFLIIFANNSIKE